jgi:uncharacterized protein YndB with AHSA1/START domain
MQEPGGDRARVVVHVAVDQREAFRIFTEDIDRWWRRGQRYRVAGTRPGVVRLEPGVGGRLVESFHEGDVVHIHEAGRIIAWEPPRRLALAWRGANFGPDEVTEIEVRFEARPRGTEVTLTHRGWSHIRPDHPARHGLAVPGFIRMLGLWWGEQLSSLREHAAADG